MQPTGDYLNILKIKPAMCTTRASVDYFADSVDRILSEGFVTTMDPTSQRSSACRVSLRQTLNLVYQPSCLLKPRAS